MQEATPGPVVVPPAVAAKAEQVATKIVEASVSASPGQPRVDAQRQVLEQEIRELPGPAPLHPRVKFATVGAGAGFGLGKLVTSLMVGQGWVDHDTAQNLEPFIDLLAAVGGSFLGGWLPKP